MVSTIPDFTVESEASVILLQSSDTEFLQLANTPVDEPEPDANTKSKVRFFYAPTGALNVDAIRLDFIAYDFYMTEMDMAYRSVTVKKGELSPYIELNAAKYTQSGYVAGFAYSVYNAETNELIYDVMATSPPPPVRRPPRGGQREIRIVNK